MMCVFPVKMWGVVLSVKGEFSHTGNKARLISCALVTRHAMLVDQKTESVVVPLNASLKSDSKLELANSMYFAMVIYPELIFRIAGSLSEMAVLGVRFLPHRI